MSIAQYTKTGLKTNKSLTSTVIALLLANGFVLFEAMSGRINLFAVMLLYWAEMVFLMLPQILKVLMNEVPVENDSIPPKIFKMFLFVVFFFTYVILIGVQGYFTMNMFGTNAHVDPSSLFYGIILIQVSHVLSFGLNYIGHDEYKTKPLMEVFFEPYKRIIVLQITIFAGALFVTAVNRQTAAIAAFVVAKTAIDLFIHLHEHKKR